MWLFQNVGRGKLPIINYSGGTEISGGIVMGNVLTPMKPCAFSGPLPGMAADVVDENGKSVRGKVGELVIREPWIGMTRGFWKDRERYIESYWSRWPDTWVHGDWAAIDDDGLWYILGRSDDTIKIAGKRLGPAEVESILVAHPQVSEAAAVGVPDPIKGEALVCFCVLKKGANGDDDLASALKSKVATELGKALMPKVVLFVADIPKTRNAKVMRRIVRAGVHRRKARRHIGIGESGEPGRNYEKQDEPWCPDSCHELVKQHGQGSGTRYTIGLNLPTTSCKRPVI